MEKIKFKFGSLDDDCFRKIHKLLACCNLQCHHSLTAFPQISFTMPCQTFLSLIFNQNLENNLKIYT
jgi:hypothetical protein